VAGNPWNPPAPGKGGAGRSAAPRSRVEQKQQTSSGAIESRASPGGPNEPPHHGADERLAPSLSLEEQHGRLEADTGQQEASDPARRFLHPVPVPRIRRFVDPRRVDDRIPADEAQRKVAIESEATDALLCLGAQHGEPAQHQPCQAEAGLARPSVQAVEPHPAHLRPDRYLVEQGRRGCSRYG